MRRHEVRLFRKHQAGAFRRQQHRGLRLEIGQLELALQHKRPAANADCDNPVEKNVELGRSLRVNSTPTLIFANGEKVAGGMNIQDLLATLDEIAKGRRR